MAAPTFPPSFEDVGYLLILFMLAMPAIQLFRWICGVQVSLVATAAVVLISQLAWLVPLRIAQRKWDAHKNAEEAALRDSAAT
jgi:hypothetical protein